MWATVVLVVIAIAVYVIVVRLSAMQPPDPRFDSQDTATPSERSGASTLGQSLVVLSIVLAVVGVLGILGVMAGGPTTGVYGSRPAWGMRILWAGGILLSAGSTAGILAGLGVLLQRNATTTSTD
jgi:hypothetical protein